MTYQETLDWLFRQLPMYQQLGDKAYRVDLTNIRKLSARLHNPHLNFKSIHVAGTNGKGSVSHMLASVLQESGLKVGLYTSPHLKNFTERIKINGQEISEEAVIEFVKHNKSFFEKEHLSFFEMTVGLAFQYFSEERVDVAVIEVGLGGRLDSTNIITPELSVITNIGYDHTNILGNTLPEIAQEKAGIIKEGVPVVVGETHSETIGVFEKVASEFHAPLFLAEDYEGKGYESDLKGYYQKKNIKTVLAALQVLNDQQWPLTARSTESGLNNVIANTGLRGRWEVLRQNPKTICDTAHNKEGLQLAMEQLLDEDFVELHMVLGVVADKDLSAILPLLPREARYYFCRPNIPRGMPAAQLKEKASEFGLFGEVYNSVSEAYQAAVNTASETDVVYVGGSTFTVAEII